ncbi:OppA family ABC transporter substrate-binding lipoprotein [Mycoplasmopsis alligatoris]|uniref:Lipoprotein n=1 Tax=Mycoplasmopsis alligatoris A21JP2 TaxID=747682 RepID=D4XVC4_9BACT|nr:hypothetical protein [Mycoplasmopsis alligatoris]EFF41631.1 hypothetical protein MALL_0660 [Mycoplasmopsis alligatoris A21JP2]
MKKNIKILTLSALSLLSAGTVAAVVSCGGGKTSSGTTDSITTVDPEKANPHAETNKVLSNILNPQKSTVKGLGNLDKLAKNRIYKREINAEFKPAGLPWDMSSSYGSFQIPLKDATTSRLLMVENYGEAAIATNSTTSAEGLVVTNKYVLRPAVWKYKLDLADALILVDASGKETVYESDAVDHLEEQPDAKGYFANPYVRLLSKDPKSINSKEFNEALKTTKNIKFRMRKDVVWSTYDGKDSGTRVVADDIYIGYMRSQLYGQEFRRENGGSKEQDAASKKLVDYPGWLAEGRTYANEYLLGLYGVDASKVKARDQFVSTKDNREYVTFQGTEGQVQKWDLFLNNVTDSYEWVAAPSQYIKKGYGDAKGLQSDKANVDFNSVHAELQKTKGLVKDAGYYWYGMTTKNTLFAGKFLGQPFNGTQRYWSAKLNKNYWDKEYAEDPKSLLELQEWYQQTAADAKQFASNEFNAYRSGDVSVISFSRQEPANQDLIKRDPVNFGLTYIQDKNTSSYTNRSGWALVPRPAVNEKLANAQPMINEVAAKLLFNVDDLSKMAKGTEKNLLEYTAAGRGRAFRTLLSLATNWAGFATQITTGIPTRPWNFGYATEAKINGKDQESAKYKTPRDALEVINNYFAVDETGKKVKLGSYANNDELDLRKSEETAVNAGANDKLKSAAFAEVKAEMKKLLDKFYEENKQFAGKNVEITFPARFLAVDQKFENAANLLLSRVYGELDPRLKFTFTKINNRDDFDVKWQSGKTAFNLLGWGYDYEGLGGGFDASSWQSELFATFALIATKPDVEAKFAAYPAMVRAAKALQTELKGKKLSVPFEKWYTLDQADMDNLGHALGRNKIDEKTGKLVDLTKEDEKLYDKEDGYFLSAQFWLKYQISNTNDELIQLAKEIGNFYGVSLNQSHTSLSELFTEVVVNPNYVRPVAYDRFTSYADYKVV